jgi:thiopurine S-methyltransferase
MELSYWQSRWKKGNIGFHLDEVYPGLVEHREALQISQESAVLVPMCGKSMDLMWLAERVRKVVGVEVSEVAVQDFFLDYNLSPVESSFAGFSIFKARNIELWCGDFFKLPVHKFQHPDLIYDKGAAVALPKKMRKNYSDIITSLASSTTELLIQHFEYPETEMNGPPFSVSPSEIEQLFGDVFSIKQLDKKSLNINRFEKFLNRGLKSYLIEYLTLLSSKKSI